MHAVAAAASAPATAAAPATAFRSLLLQLLSARTKYFGMLTKTSESPPLSGHTLRHRLSVT